MDAATPILAHPLRTIASPVICVVICAGCSAPARPTHETAAMISVADGNEFDRLWDVTTQVLRAHRFHLSWEDRASGVIETLPVTSGSWFEWWRHDVADDYSSLEANLHAVRRSASIHLSREQDQQTYRLAVRVDESRLSYPERQVTSPASAIQMFGSRLPTAEGLVIPIKESQSWTPMGRDGAVESQLLGEIMDEFGASYCRRILPAEQNDHEPDDNG